MPSAFHNPLIFNAQISVEFGPAHAIPIDAMAQQTIETATNWQELSDAARRDRRLEKRVSLVFPIEISGLDLAGGFFSERSRTWNISERGCRFALRTELRPGSIVAIRVINREPKDGPGSKALLYQIEWVRKEEGRWVMGASSMQGRGLWNVAFPESN